MSSLNWAILGTGSIARQFGGGLKVCQSGQLATVGSRTQESAQKFADQFGGKAYGSYQEAIDDPNVDAVYIALPHHLHSEWTIKTAQAGKMVLCEKPFTLTHAEAERTLEAVEKAGVFFMEAFMYRCHPQTIAVKKMVDEGKIGRVQMVNSEFGFAASADWDNFRTVNAYGAGALMDVGCYCLSYARLIFGQEPTHLDYSAHIGTKKYDEVGVGNLTFGGNQFSHFGTAFHLNLENKAIIYGAEGHIVVDDPWKVRPGSKVSIYSAREKTPVEVLDLSTTNDELYAHEADEVARCAGKRESERVRWADTLGQMKALDQLRKCAGLVFEGEETR